MTGSLACLSCWVTLLIILAQFKTARKYSIVICFIILFLRLFSTFTANNLLIFYYCFEWALIPIFWIVMGWGYQPERLKAGLCLFFYTLFSSLPLLVVMLVFHERAFHGEMYFMPFTPLLSNLGGPLVHIFTVLAFLVKFPIWGVHLWLPKAHVEAPVAGSMILAGVMLKLGGYGLIRLYSIVALSETFCFVIRVALVGGGILGILCTIIRDIKVIIAYSSVVHMALIVVGIIRFSTWGLAGGMIIIVAHGLCSSGIFALANLIYERTHSRSLILNKGSLNLMPSLSISWFLLIVANFGGPFTFNLLGEILLIINLTQVTEIFLMSVCLLSFFSAAYSLILYSRAHQGRLSGGSIMSTFSNAREDLILFRHIWPLLFLCFSPYISYGFLLEIASSNGLKPYKSLFNIFCYQGNPYLSGFWIRYGPNKKDGFWPGKNKSFWVWIYP